MIHFAGAAVQSHTLVTSYSGHGEMGSREDPRLANPDYTATDLINVGMLQEVVSLLSCKQFTIRAHSASQLLWVQPRGETENRERVTCRTVRSLACGVSLGMSLVACMFADSETNRLLQGLCFNPQAPYSQSMFCNCPLCESEEIPVAYIWACLAHWILYSSQN